MHTIEINDGPEIADSVPPAKAPRPAVTASATERAAALGTTDGAGLTAVYALANNQALSARERELAGVKAQLMTLNAMGPGNRGPRIIFEELAATLAALEVDI